MKLKSFYFALVTMIFILTGTSIFAQGVNISGNIINPDGLPVEKVKISSENSSGLVEETITAEDGTYSFSNLSDGTYIVTPSYTGYTFFPLSTTVTVSGSDVKDINFIADVTMDSPLDIPGCVLWLDASDPLNQGHTHTGALKHWFDKSPKSNDLSSPKYYDIPIVEPKDLLGGKPAVYMDGGELYSFNSMTDVRTVFWVIEEDDSSLNSFLGDRHHYSFSRGALKNGENILPDGTFWRKLNGSRDAADEVINGQTYLDSVLIDGVTEKFPTETYHIVSLVTTGTVTANSLSWLGNIAEIIIYDTPLNDADRFLVENYLKKRWFAPVAADDNYNAPADGQVQIQQSIGLLSNDTNYTPDTKITASVVSLPEHGSLQLNSDGSFIYMPVSGFKGADSFTYKVDNGTFISNIATVHLTVIDQASNTPPAVFKDQYQAFVSNILSVSEKDGVLSNDFDSENNHLYVILTEDVKHGTLSLDYNGAFQYTPEENWDGIDYFYYKATDNIEESTPIKVTITVAKELENPLLISDCSMWLDAADIAGDGTKLSGYISKWVNKANKTLSVYQPTKSQLALVVEDSLNGHSTMGFFNNKPSYNIVYKSGLQEKIKSQTFFWLIKETRMPDDAPHFFLGNSDGPVFGRGEMPKNIGMVTSVGNGIYWSQYASDAVKNGKTYLDGQEVNGTEDDFPNNQFHIVTLETTNPVQFDSITVDRQGKMGSRSWKGNIAEIITYNKHLEEHERKAVEEYLRKKWMQPSPKAENDYYVCRKNSILQIPQELGLLKNDEINALTPEIIEYPYPGTITLNPDGSFEFIPTKDYTGTVKFTYRLTNGSTSSNIAEVTISIAEPNEGQALFAESDQYTVIKDSIFKIDINNGLFKNDYSENGNPLKAVLASNTKNGKLDLSPDGTFTYEPPQGWTGTDSFSYYITDNLNNSKPVDVKLIVKAIIESPLELPDCVMLLDFSHGSWGNEANYDKNLYQPNEFFRPKFKGDALNGLSTLSFTTGNETFVIVNPQGKYVKISASTFFWVIKENNIDYAHFFLGSYATTPFHRGISEDDSFKPTGIYWDKRFAAPQVREGKTYLDGIPVDGVNDVFPVGEYHIVSLVATGPVEFDQITQDGYMKAPRSWNGEIGEIIAYNKILSDKERKSVEKYLQKKWFAEELKGELTGIILDAESNPVPNVGVMIDSEYWTTTDSEGKYSIVNVPNGTYTVKLKKDGYTFEPNELNIEITDNTVTADFTANKIIPTFEITGCITDYYKLPLMNVEVFIDENHTAFTDKNGNYVIQNLKPASYTVTPSLSEYIFKPENLEINIVDAGIANVDFSGFYKPAPQYTLSVIYGNGGGEYRENSTVSITATIPAGQIFDTWTGDTSGIADVNSASTIVIMPAEDITVTATFKQIPENNTISGTISGDVSAGVIVAVDATHFATTDSDGNYTITDLPEGSFTVMPSFDGYKFTPQTATVVIAGTGTALTGIDFVAKENNDKLWSLTVKNGSGTGEYFTNSTIAISANIPDGQIFDVWLGDTEYIDDPSKSTTIVTMPDKNITVTAVFKDAPNHSHSVSGTITGDIAAGVTVTIDENHSAVTDAHGDYTIGDLDDGTYVVTPSLTDYTFSPQLVQVVLAGPDSNISDINFKAVKSNSEEYTLIVENGTGDGKYKAGDVAVISATVPNDYIFDCWTGDTQYLNDLTLAVAALTMPEKNVSVTATFKKPLENTFSISGTITGDVIKDVTVAVDPVYSTTTDESGHYTISGLTAGDYTVTALLTEYTFTPETISVTIDDVDLTDIDFISEKIKTEVGITLGSQLKYKASDIPLLKGDTFAKVPKLYGVLENGKKGTFKKVKSSTVSEFSGTWNKKFPLYDKKALKSGYKLYFDTNGPCKSTSVTVMVKGKTTSSNKIDTKLATVQLVPPVVTDIQNTAGASITKAKAGSTIVLIGQFFGEKPAKVSLEVNGKLISCKVDKKALKYQSNSGSMSAMDPITGNSALVVILPSKKITPGIYSIVLDNKIGIATTPGEKETLPIITIEQ